jgi:peptidyl-prolyl cis-trans isomerase C
MPMKRPSAAATLAIGALLVISNFATTAHAESKVLARADGIDITEDDVKLAESEIGPNLGSVPADQRLRLVVEYLIDNRLMASAAQKANLGSDPSMQARLDYYKNRALRDLFYEKNVGAAVTEAEAKAAYDKQVAAQPPVEEVHARHILVDKKEDAEDIEAKLKGGADFAQLAKDKSKDTGSAPNGGDLGFFAKGQMVKEFEDAVWVLKPGDVSPPVQTQFGWHVIKLEEKRVRPAPPFDGLKDRIMQSLLQQKFGEVLEGLHKSAKIEWVDETLKKSEAASATQQAPAQ